MMVFEILWLLFDFCAVVTMLLIIWIKLRSRRGKRSPRLESSGAELVELIGGPWDGDTHIVLERPSALLVPHGQCKLRYERTKCLSSDGAIIFAFTERIHPKRKQED